MKFNRGLAVRQNYRFCCIILELFEIPNNGADEGVASFEIVAGFPASRFIPGGAEGVKNDLSYGIIMIGAEGAGLVVFFESGVVENAEAKVDGVSAGTVSLDDCIIILAGAFLEKGDGGCVPVDLIAGLKGRLGHNFLPNNDLRRVEAILEIERSLSGSSM